MRVQYFGGRKRIPSTGKVLKNGDILEWEGPLVMGMVALNKPEVRNEMGEQISDVGDLDNSARRKAKKSEPNEEVS